MRITWAGTFDPELSRNRQLLRFLEAGKVEFDVVRLDLWPTDRIAALQHARLRLLLKMLFVYPRLLAKLLMSPRPDVYLVSYPGWFDVPIVRIAAAVHRRPVVFDIFISLYETAVTDREMVRPKSVVGRFAGLVDRVSIRMSHKVIADCPAHAEYLASFAGVDEDRFAIIFLGADEEVFHQQRRIPTSNLVLYYGTFVPLHGPDVIVRAAARLKERGVRFRIIGDGQLRDEMVALAGRLEATNIEFVRTVSHSDLVEEIRNAAVCLGVFGRTEKANRVIPHKVFEALACGRPVLTAATDAIVDTFGGHDLATCPPDDPDELAKAILRLLSNEDVRESMASRGRDLFERRFSKEALGDRLAHELRSMG